MDHITTTSKSVNEDWVGFFFFGFERDKVVE